MSKQVPPAEIEAARAYEDLMVPSLFGQWAAPVADAVQVSPGQRALDLACGTGVLARDLAARVAPSGTVTGLDPSLGMLEIARQSAPDIAWRDGVAESLPFPDQAFDAVASQFGLMFFSDRGAALRDALRVLSPGGRLAFAVWDSMGVVLSEDQVARILDEAELVLRPWVTGEGTVSFEIAAHIVTGSRNRVSWRDQRRQPAVI